ncbi:hypothetical protein JRQ81_001095 [Phrynocephalus forsythii]|uniref:Uncharacterized protein n=1 Tax=Phrynocephalus forsythii TaxID=171643 RepID=A0A9Q0Y6I9_9SAUR|nr:hypothetical protein JRQ81_001095 [Phrynocephalus forsythii]
MYKEIGKNVISLQVDIMVSKCSSENVHTEVTEINTLCLNKNAMRETLDE